MEYRLFDTKTSDSRDSSCSRIRLSASSARVREEMSAGTIRGQVTSEQAAVLLRRNLQSPSVVSMSQLMIQDMPGMGYSGLITARAWQVLEKAIARKTQTSWLCDSRLHARKERVVVSPCNARAFHPCNPNFHHRGKRNGNPGRSGRYWHPERKK